jgi:hypothetical protein
VFARLESKGLKQETARTYIQAVGGVRLVGGAQAHVADFTHLHLGSQWGPHFELKVQGCSPVLLLCLVTLLALTAQPLPLALWPILPPCSKAVGHKFGQHLPRAVPLCIRYLRSAAEGDDELREYCLQVRYCHADQSFTGWVALAGR